ncbi:ribosomal protein subunit Img2 [Schizosaccharomyces cryophilus OY26]|uniref:Large ribosomal subunit protein mL49 n=1 Tax=Schizosaccharomyces cryophilus (strain OY26 / ATCC MYA-4695 / CBS 11777 / NBRC 106824 / NRRL Y48691) TaxID=653667 RepID=S9W6K9_SCHCR|nr:ribosomal protein subunit Img2 [Schizosaccharomyces cryophilus OY26]EPY54169.1 ribosomal protein subunit Img2 [Schizosaccharomyces cryophilus OY26]
MFLTRSCLGVLRRYSTKTPKSLPFTITRTETANFPVYIDYKSGGNQVQTIIRRIEGDDNALLKELITDLGIPRADASINQLTKHIRIKGNHSQRIKQWIQDRGF